MGRQGRKHPSFAKCVARRADGMLLEITLSPTIWKEYLFHVITAARSALQEPVWECTKVDIINELYLLCTNEILSTATETYL